MIRLTPSEEARNEHTEAVIKRIQQSYDEKRILDYIKKLGINSIKDFLEADVSTMRKWTEQCSNKLKFTVFKEIYNRYFSNGSNKYVDEESQYNAYKFLENLQITVCPYCEDEYLDAVDINDKKRRTSEIDHFFAKSTYPALAMCFYNLVPSGQNCNGLKLDRGCGMNPYEKDIEEMTWLFPDIPIGISMEKIMPSECKVLFHPQGGMVDNVRELGLEQRYEKHAPEVYRLLKNAQNYTREKIQELVKMGFGTREEIISSNFGPQDLEEKKKTLRQKMLRDLTGY